MSDKMWLWMPDHIMSIGVSVGRAHLKKVIFSMDNVFYPMIYGMSSEPSLFAYRLCFSETCLPSWNCLSLCRTFWTFLLVIPCLIRLFLRDHQGRQPTWCPSFAPFWNRCLRNMQADWKMSLCSRRISASPSELSAVVQIALWTQSRYQGYETLALFC